jgi:hypothetical protein
MVLNTRFWLRFSLVNLLFVALLGLLMRYKIGFEFPYFEQKNLQHSHSHFAFSGWVSHTLMVLILHFFRANPLINIKKYHTIIFCNLIASYGMLVFFIIQGYAFMSIVFSTASMIVSYVFAYHFIKDIKLVGIENISKNWFKSGVIFSVLSSVGTLVLVYLMATKTISEPVYLSSIYYYLHFQYNGWFFFGCMGLFYTFSNISGRQHPFYITTFRIFAASCIPAYFLSTLWLDLPQWIYLLCVIAAIFQVYAWFRFLYLFIKSKNQNISALPALLRYLLAFIGFAVSIKLLLQLGSTIPQMSQLAFGFRPIVIAYLHLVLLAIISLFLLFYCFASKLLPMTTGIKTGLKVFILGVVANEVILALQGTASLDYVPIPFVNEMLFGAAIVLVAGVGIMVINLIKQTV